MIMLNAYQMVTIDWANKMEQEKYGNSKVTFQFQHQNIMLMNNGDCRESEVNLQILMLYVSITDNDLPSLPHTTEQSGKLATEMRMYFNDEQLIITEEEFKGGNYLASEQFEARLWQVFNQFVEWIGNAQPNCSFLEFLEFYVYNHQTLKVYYQPYEQLILTTIQTYLHHLITQTAKSSFSKPPSKQPTSQSNPTQSKQSPINVFTQKPSQFHKDNCDDESSKTQASKTSIHHKHSKQLPKPTDQQPQDPFNYYLHKFYDHYSKKSANTLKTQLFQKLQHFYNTLNLTKFLAYCKQFNLLKAHKNINVKYVQQIFIKNQDHRNVVEYEAFAKMVKQLLFLVYQDQTIVQTEGYGLIGVRRRENFVQKMKKIGVIVPLKKVVFSKPKQVKEAAVDMGEFLRRQQELEAMRQQQQKENSAKSQSNAKNGGYEYAYESAWRRIHQTRPNLVQTSHLPQLAGQSGSRLGGNLQGLLDLDSEEDAYLSRFKKAGDAGRQKESAEESGVIARMDRRIENVVRRIR